MSTTNLALLTALATPPPTIVNDALVAFAGGTQMGATPLRSQINRVTGATAANASCVLPSLNDGDEGAGLVFVINDATNAIAVFCSPGDTMNSVANGSVAIAAGGFGIFLKVASLFDWRAKAFT